jgi:hypothetical protein
MFSGRTYFSYSSGVNKPRETVASFKEVPSLWAFLAALAASVKKKRAGENGY